MTKNTSSRESFSKSIDMNQNFQQKFLYVEKASDLVKLKKLDGIELCVVKTIFSKTDLEAVKLAKKYNPNVEFWFSSNQTTRNHVLLANELEIKNIVSSPFDLKLVEDFFKGKDIEILKSESAKHLEYPPLKGLKVMIVDDNSMNVTLLEEILSGFELEISSFLKSTEACKAIMHEKFDLFLLDIMMPDMSGFDLAKQIKLTPHNQDTPIIFISALSDSQTQIKGYDLGSFAYIEKPFDINIVKSQIYNLLKTKKAQEVVASNKESFFASVAHDLKTPINAEMNALKLLLDEKFGDLDGEQKEIIEDLLDSTQYMRDIVENVLCRSKLESGKMELVKQVCCMNELARHCIELTKYIVSAKNQNIIFKCTTDKTLAKFDFLEMKRAIHNVIANASAYSSSGTDIIVEIFKKGDKLGISIQDFGKGIELEKQKDIFSQYMSYAKQYKTLGSGLGLYITKNIVEAHGGEVLLDSEVNKGTKISILIPSYTKV